MELHINNTLFMTLLCLVSRLHPHLSLIAFSLHYYSDVIKTQREFRDTFMVN